MRAKKSLFFFSPRRADACLELHGLDPGRVPVCGPKLGRPRGGWRRTQCRPLSGSAFQRGRAKAALEDPFKPVSGETRPQALRAVSHGPGAWLARCCFPRTLPLLLEPVGSRGNHSFCRRERGRLLQGHSAFSPARKRRFLWGEEMKGLSKWKERHGKMNVQKNQSEKPDRSGLGSRKF